MAARGTGVLSTVQPVQAQSYSYNYVVSLMGPGTVPVLVSVGSAPQQGNARYLTRQGTHTAVWDGTAWVTPQSVWDVQTGAWLPYDKVYDGTSWVAAQ